MRFVGLALPTFISACGLGGMRSMRSIILSVSWSIAGGLAMDEDIRDNFTNIYVEVGKITISWAHIDHLMDYCSFLLKDRHGEHPKWESLPRTRLNQKIEMLRDYLSDAPTLASVSARGLALADSVEALSKERHWVIHGSADLLGDPDNIRLVRTNMKGVPSIEDRNVTTDDLRLLTAASGTLVASLSSFVIRDLLGLTENEINEIRRKNGVGGS